MIFLLIILVIIIIILLSRIVIVNQASAYVVERLGAYKCTLTTGVHFILPFIEKVANKVSLKEQVLDFPPQPVITKDNVTMQIDTVVYCQITDPKLVTYGIENPMRAVENLTATTLRNIIGELDLDSTLTSRDIINSKMRSILDEATDKWGIKVNRVEVKNIMPPKEIQDSMEKQMKAERERREQILQAEGAKRSAVLVAEGNKEAAILNAEAEKESKLRIAEANRQQAILEAQGQAEAIKLVKKAQAEGIGYLSDVDLNEAILKLKSFEAMEKVADGKATKLIIPSELQNLTTIGASLKEAMSDSKKIAETLDINVNAKTVDKVAKNLKAKEKK